MSVSVKWIRLSLGITISVDAEPDGGSPHRSLLVQSIEIASEAGSPMDVVRLTSWTGGEVDVLLPAGSWLAAKIIAEGEESAKLSGLVLAGLERKRP